jgi:beta-glucanase (GH16 family)
MRRLLLLLTAATSLNCQVKTAGLAGLFDDASAIGTRDASATSLDGAVAGTGGQGGAGAQGELDAWPASDARTTPNTGGGGSPTTVVASGGAPALDGATLSTGGNAGSGGMDGGTPPSTGGLGGARPDGSALPDGRASDLPTTVDSPILPNPDVGPDLQPLPDLGADQPTSPADTADLRPTNRRDVGPEASDDSGLPLLWHDEFEGAANTAPDGSKWEYVTWGPSGGVNNERQQYTSSLDNVFLDGEGHLVIRALRTAVSNAQAAQYTSGRINTKSNFWFKTGRMEVRAKLPAGIGSFPGIITMGTEGGWPQCGELALVEQYGQDKDWFYASAYADNGSESGNKRNVRYDFANTTTASSEFHVYSVDWYSDHLVFQVDGDEILRTSYGTSSPFYTTPEYIVLDVAVGGTMGGTIDPEGFPMDMVVDYVRVYSF